MDNLIELLEKQKKTSFEAYLCGEHLSPLNMYKDLKGTIAFRNLDLALADATFSEIPETFWDTNYEYKYYLNEDPYIPKNWNYVHKRDFNYDFSKPRFIKELIALEKEAKENPAKAAENYLKLGHAFFNCSYWGNSWMMTSYGMSSSEPYSSYSDLLFGAQYPQRQKMQEGNYYYCRVAKKYYEKALAAKHDNEQGATASMMVHSCDYLAYEAKGFGIYEKRKDFVAGNAIQDFFGKYSDTDVFRRMRCGGLERFVD